MLGWEGVYLILRTKNFFDPEILRIYFEDLMLI